MAEGLVSFRRGWMRHPGFANDYEKLIYAHLVEQAAVEPGTVTVKSATVRVKRGELPISAKSLAERFTGPAQATLRYEGVINRLVVGGLITIRHAPTERKSRLIAVARIVDFVG